MGCYNYVVGDYDVMSIAGVGANPPLETLRSLLAECEGFCESIYEDTTCCTAFISTGEDFICYAARGTDVTYEPYSGALDWSWGSSCAR